ncbi:MAG: NAD(P)/FAD-dependent oxidoreductase [Candidatus Bathyarchaeia archaeon]
MLNVLIAGCGVGGLSTALYLSRDVKGKLGREVEILAIDRDSSHCDLSHLAKVISGLPPDKICVPYERFRRKGLDFVRGEITAIDPGGRSLTVVTGDGRKEYDGDILVLALGSEPDYHGIRGAKEHTYPVYNLHGALGIREALRGIPRQEAHDGFDCVFVGGGDCGVEFAMEAHKAAPDAKIGLIGTRAQIPVYHKRKTSNFVKRYLEKNGMELILNSRVSEVGDGYLILERGGGENVMLKSRMTGWAAGTKPPRLIEECALPADENGLKVNAYLQSVADEAIFGVGDINSLPTRKLAISAQQQADVVARNIVNHLRGKDLVEFVPRENPMLITLGKGMAVCEWGDFTTWGRPLDWLKKYVRFLYRLDPGNGLYRGIHRVI